MAVALSAALALRAIAAEPTTRPAASQPAGRLAEECARRVAWLTDKGAGRLAVINDPPFVLAGDMKAPQLEQYRRHTVRRAAAALWKKYFDARPDRTITILLFANAESYQHYAAYLLGDKDLPHFGYARHADRTLVMNIGTGGGTLVHELVHALIAFDFPEVPDWFNEGLASLYEQCWLPADGNIVGRVNWRLPALKQAITRKTLRPLRDLVTKDDFRTHHEGLNYAQARYLCMHMQQRGCLVSFYKRFRQRRKADPTGVACLQEAFGGRSVEDIEKDFLAWVMTLEYPPKE